MIIEWLYRTTIETTILIALVLLLRPIVRKTLGAKIAYWLWALPLIRVLLPDRPERSGTVLEAIGVPTENLQTEFIPTPNIELSAMPMEFPWEWVWLAGVSAWLVLRLITWLRFRQALLNTATPLVLSQQLLEKVSTKIHWLPEKIQFYSCISPSAPFVTGLFRAKVFLPRDFEQRFTTEEQSWVIVHELSHVQRKDLWVQFLGECLRAVFWFNPFIHFAVLVAQEDQELACDHSVLSHCAEEDRYHYGKALLAGAGPQLVPSVMTFFSKGKERFTMLAKHKVSKLNTIIGVCLCAVISVFALTKAPLSIAQNKFFKDDPISLGFKEMPLEQSIQLIANFNNLQIFNRDIVDNKNIKLFITAKDVPANVVFEEVLACGGFGYIEYESGIEITIKEDIANGPVNYCMITADMHQLIEGSEVHVIDKEGNVLYSQDSKVTKFR